MLVFALLGFAYGIVLQRSSFCFARAAYELFLLRTRYAVYGVMAGLLTATVGFGAVSLARSHLGIQGHGNLLTLPAGGSTLLGGVLFGIGMVISGMCAAGTLQRIGEGYAIAWAVLAGIIAGAALNPFRGLYLRELIPLRSGPSLAQLIGPGAGFLMTIAVLAVLWIVLARSGAAPRRPAAPEPWRARARALLTPPVVGGVLLGVLNTVQMAAVMPWTVGYPLTLVPGVLSGGPSQATVRAALPLLALDGCMVLGALVAGAVGRGLSFRWPRRRVEVINGLGGGILMGWGIQTAHGCNIGGVFSAIPSLSVSGWLYLPAILFGAWLGVKIIRRTG